MTGCIEVGDCACLGAKVFCVLPVCTHFALASDHKQLLHSRICWLPPAQSAASCKESQQLAAEPSPSSNPARFNSSHKPPTVINHAQAIKPPIKTVALGATYSYASLLVAAGTKGRRYSMKNTRLMMTQPMGGSQGDIYAIAETVKELNAIYQVCWRGCCERPQRQRGWGGRVAAQGAARGAWPLRPSRRNAIYQVC